MSFCNCSCKVQSYSDISWRIKREKMSMQMIQATQMCSCFLTPPISDLQLSVWSPPLSYPISADVCLMFARKGVGVFLHLYCSGKHSSLYIKSSVLLLAHTPLTPKSTQEEMRGREGGVGKKQGHQNGCEERDWRSTWGRVHGEHIIRTIYSQCMISKGTLK